jgi:threonine/homoserine/homoserine lactone efflux protein
VDLRFGGFVIVAALLIMVPGPDMALVTRNALRDGRRAAAATAWGVGVGILGWAIASGIGLAALLSASAVTFSIVKLAGAAYLIYLGLKSLRRGIANEGLPTSTQRGRFSDDPFLQGVLGNLLNPKAAVIFLTVLPQFIHPGDPPLRLLAMLAVFELMIIGWLHLYGFAVARAGQAFGTSRLRRWLSALTGAVLVGLGFRLALERS